MPDADPTQRRYSGLTAEERRAGRRRALIDAGLELYGTRRYAEVTVAGLVAEAGVTLRAFYESFEGQEALLRAVHDEVVAAGGEVTEAARGGAEGVEGVERGLRAAIQFFTADVRRIRVQFEAVVGVSDAMEHHRRVTTRAIADRYGTILGDAAGPDAVARRRAAMQFTGGVSAQFVDWLWSPDSTLDELQDEMLLALRRRFGGCDLTDTR